ncbi:glutamate 5-kinase [Cutibacterium acnes JCM 18918]|nr:glutamate 5-kinase [Cutibacterium acnes JCM 18918]
MTDQRGAICGAATLVVKVGSSSLTLPGGGIDVRRVDDLVDALSEVIAVGRRVVLVSSGAIATGFPAMGITHRPRTLAGKQAAASVGQGILLAHYASRFASHGLRVGQVLLTVNDLVRPTSYRNAWSTLDTLLGLGVVPIVNENDTVATGEIRFGDNDRLAALVAELVRAQALILLSDVDALYTAHPDSPDARRVEVVEDIDTLDVDTHKAGSGVGTGGMTTKLEAARMATCAGVPVYSQRRWMPRTFWLVSPWYLLPPAGDATAPTVAVVGRRCHPAGTDRHRRRSCRSFDTASFLVVGGGCDSGTRGFPSRRPSDDPGLRRSSCWSRYRPVLP